MPNTERKTKSKTIAAGSRVTMHFRLSMENGFVAEDTYGSEPHTIEIGSGELLPDVESELIGLKVGDEKTIQLPPQNAYGFRSDERIYIIPRNQFSPEWKLEPGKIIAFSLPNGEEVAGAVVSVDEQSVTMDLNHPLAGYDVIFDIQIVEIK